MGPGPAEGRPPGALEVVHGAQGVLGSLLLPCCGKSSRTSTRLFPARLYGTVAERCPRRESSPGPSRAVSGGPGGRRISSPPSPLLGGWSHSNRQVQGPSGTQGRRALGGARARRGSASWSPGGGPRSPGAPGLFSSSPAVKNPPEPRADFSQTECMELRASMHGCPRGRPPLAEEIRMPRGLWV